MNKKERVLFALGDVDDKFVKEAEPNTMAQKKRIITIAASLALVVALSLYLFIPFRDAVSDLSAYEGSEYYPLIKTIDNYYLAVGYENDHATRYCGTAGEYYINGSKQSKVPFTYYTKSSEISTFLDCSIAMSSKDSSFPH